MLTINGRVRLWRRRWHSPAEGTTTPLDAWLDTVEGSISLGVREMACRLNGDGKNFDKAAANLARTAQVHVCGETLRVLVEAEGRRVVQAQRSEQLPVGWSATDCRVEPEAKTTRLYLGSDGVMVPLVTDAEKTSRRQRVKQERRKRGKRARPLPPRKAGADQGYKEFKIVAFYDEAYGEDDESGRGWAGRLLHVFKHEGYEPAWKQLLEWRVGLRHGRPAADRLVNYVSERREMIKYPEFQAKGWQIGSGPTEATCKTLTARLKGSGMRWDGGNAEALMGLEALTQSGQWDLYWRSQLRQTG